MSTSKTRRQKRKHKQIESLILAAEAAHKACIQQMPLRTPEQEADYRYGMWRVTIPVDMLLMNRKVYNLTDKQFTLRLLSQIKNGDLDNGDGRTITHIFRWLKENLPDFDISELEKLLALI